MSLEYVRKNRRLPFLKRGMRVELSYKSKTKSGKITGANRSANIQVLFDGENTSQNCHPLWAMKYFDDNGNVLADFSE